MRSKEESNATKVLTRIPKPRALSGAKRHGSPEQTAATLLGGYFMFISGWQIAVAVQSTECALFKCIGCDQIETNLVLALTEF